MTDADFSWRQSIVDWLNTEMLPYKIVFTPLGFLEAVGQKVSEYPKIDLDHSLTVSSMLESVVDASREFFRNQDYLSQQRLIDRAHEQLNWTSSEPSLQRIFQDTIGRFVDTPGAMSDLYEYLTYDNLQSQDYGPKAIEAHWLILRAIFIANAEGENISPFRLMYMMYMETCTQSNEGQYPAEAAIIDLRPQEELLDTDWIHAATYGLVLDGEIRQVRIVTSESLASFRDRVCWAKSCWNNILTKMLELSKLDFEFPRAKLGFIHHCTPNQPDLGEIYSVESFHLPDEDLNGYTRTFSASGTDIN